MRIYNSCLCLILIVSGELAFIWASGMLPWQAVLASYEFLVFVWSRLDNPKCSTVIYSAHR